MIEIVPQGTSKRAVDPKTFWTVLGQRPVGLTIVTAEDSHGPAGFLGLSASHVTADPPTMLVSIDHKTSALATVLSSRAFAINCLGKNGRATAGMFLSKGGYTGAARFTPDSWTKLRTGSPVSVHAVGAFDCELTDVIQRSSVSVLIGRVVDFAIREGEPLVFYRGKIQD